MQTPGIQITEQYLQGQLPLDGLAEAIDAAISLSAQADRTNIAGMLRRLGLHVCAGMVEAAPPVIVVLDARPS